MNDTIERLADGTLVFLPERLNRDPAVLRGLTNDEMWVALGTGAAIGLLLGVPLGIVTSSIAVAPTSMIASMALVLFGVGLNIWYTNRVDACAAALAPAEEVVA